MRREVRTPTGRRRWNASSGSRRNGRRHVAPCWTAPRQTDKTLAVDPRSRCPSRSPRSSDTCRAPRGARWPAAGAAQPSPCPNAAGSPSGAPPPADTAPGSSVGPQPQDSQPSKSSTDQWRSCVRSRRCSGSASRRPSLSHRRLSMSGPTSSRNSLTGSTAAASTTATFQLSGQPSLLWSKPSTVARPDAGADEARVPGRPTTRRTASDDSSDGVGRWSRGTTRLQYASPGCRGGSRTRPTRR